MSRLRGGFGAQADVVIIGGGHNGLVAAFYLARAGLKPLVLEARDEVGGGAITAEIHPGFHCPVLSHEMLLHERVVREMNLARFGLELLTPEAEVCSLAGDDLPLVLYGDAARTAESLRARHARDAEAYPAFRASVAQIASVLGAVFEAPPPSIDNPSARDLWSLLKAGRRFRSLGRRDGYRLLRWGPMPVADLVAECFGSELLRATVAAPALTGTMFGPRSAGSSLILLMRETHRQLAGGRPLRARGGPGVVTRALAAAAQAAGAEIRTGAQVDRINVENGRAAGVVVRGQPMSTSRVISTADPRTTFLTLLDPSDLLPDFAAKARNYRAAGTTAKINLAVSALPAFGIEPSWLTGRVQIGPTLDYLERAFDHAKYGELSAAPWLDMTIPSLVDPTLAPPGAHVMSVYVHYAPYRLRGDWREARDRLLATTLGVLEEHAPGIRSLVVAAQVITPLDLEQTYGFSGGHIFHGELALDQLFTMRPLLGFARYDSPIRGLHLCGAGTHPGGFCTGASGRLAAREVLRAPKI